MSNVSPLPKSMQAVRADALAASAPEPTPAPAPAGTVVAAPAPGAPGTATVVEPEDGTPQGSDAPALPPAPEERVTLSRAEYNELQASKAGTARLEAAQLRIEELTQRLTELETATKGTPQADVPPPKPLLDVGNVEFTEEEQRDFGESQEFVAKVARRVFAELAPALEDRLAKLEQGVQTATQSVARTAQSAFQERVFAAVPDLQALISHQNWGDFLDTKEEFSGKTFEQVLGESIRDNSVDRTKRIYDQFRKQYVGEPSDKPSTAAGYAGAIPSGAATVEPPNPQAVQKMKMSDRKKISEDYRKGRITWEQKEEFDKKFVEAEKNGNVDYDA